LPSFADGLADLDYVVAGAFLEFGINSAPIECEVHRSNMAKAVMCKACEGTGNGVDAPGDLGNCGTCGGLGRILLKRADGKTTKPDGWTPPDIAGVIDKQRAEPLECGLAGVLAEHGGDER